MRDVRAWVVGFGTVGRWLIAALEELRDQLQARHALSVEVVGLATRRDGFIYREGGLDVRSALAVAAGDSLRDLRRVSHWPSALDGIEATDADVLLEVSSSPAPTGEPGRSHIEAALGRGIPVVTSNKWPVALHGVALAELARSQSTVLRAEATVMSGTPVLRTLTAGVAGARPVALRGVLNATSNFVLSEIGRGGRYEDAVAEAQRIGLAERDATADLDGHDSVAKLMILAGLVFDHQLRLADVRRRGISSLSGEEIARADAEGLRIRELATLEHLGSGSLAAVLEPTGLTEDDPLSRVEGTDNAVVCRLDPIGEVTVIGPGAGTRLAGQGVLSDLIGVFR